ncbi:CTD small phosphatase-like protein 2 [Dorcoceras hygrometricum]|uniref:CTD small phosphatase-like protein 2 n=1 Tax=Dorcoceras hygrometricum TaxID=472368 RepID=A0A2Z7D1Z2_9LAMI|nr:CTD small phosphatase-like protein 2 [Dorcoceras hygrometricum]
MSSPMEVKDSILEINGKENVPPNKDIRDAQKTRRREENTHKYRAPLMDISHFYLDTSPLSRDFRPQSSVLKSGLMLSNRKKYFASARSQVYESRSKSKILRKHYFR